MSDPLPSLTGKIRRRAKPPSALPDSAALVHRVFILGAGVLLIFRVLLIPVLGVAGVPVLGVAGVLVLRRVLVVFHDYHLTDSSIPPSAPALYRPQKYFSKTVHKCPNSCYTLVYHTKFCVKG